MDENKLKEILSNVEVPPASKTAEKQAVAMALAAFEKNNQKKFQGNEKSNRPIGKSTYLWRLIMKKQFVLSGMSGAVAACALLVAIGGPLTYKMIYQHAPISSDAAVNNEMVKPKAAENVEGLSAVTSNIVASQKQNVGDKVLDLLKSAPNRAQEEDFAAPSDQNRKPSLLSVARGKAVQDKKDQLPRQRPAGQQLVQRTDADQKNARLNQIGRVAAVKGEAESSRIRAEPAKEMMEAEVRAIAVAPLASSPLPPQHQQIAEKKKMRKVAIGGLIASQNIPARSMSDDAQQNYYQDVGEDEFTDYKDASIKIVTEEPVSTFSIDVDTASYSFMRRQLNNGVLPQKDAIRVEELINYFDYDYELPAHSKERYTDRIENSPVVQGLPFKPTVAVYDSPWKAGNKMIHIGVKGYDLAPAEIKQSNLVFLLDVSGSMNSPDKLPLLKNSFKMLLESLRPDDTIAIVVYAGAAGTVLEPTKVSDKHKIIAALDRLRAGGSTAGAEGIRQAYALAEANLNTQGVNRVILATDGDFNVGITNPQELQDFVERKRETGISLSILGFGQGNYHDNLMQTLAQNGNGNAAYIDTLSEARKVLVDEANSTLFTIAKDVKIQVEFNPKMVSEYRLIGYETRHLNREDFNNDKVDAGEIGSGHTVTAIYEITPSGSAHRMVDPLRYGQALPEDHKKTKSAEGREYAFLKMRYKEPKGTKSKLMTRAITTEDVKSWKNLTDDIQFAASVAAFGQKLRGGAFVADFSYDDIIRLAKDGKGVDDFGYRTEFINLVRLAKTAAAMANHN